MDNGESAISYITLGVTDLSKMQDFYSALGFSVYKKGDSEEHPYVMYQSGALILALYPKQLLAKQAGILIDEMDQNRSFSLSLNLASKKAVEDYLAKAKQSNAVITRDAFEPAWGGYCGYFKDPENNLWEVVWHEKYQFTST